MASYYAQRPKSGIAVNRISVGRGLFDLAAQAPLLTPLDSFLVPLNVFLCFVHLASALENARPFSKFQTGSGGYEIDIPADTRNDTREFSICHQHSKYT